MWFRRLSWFMVAWIIVAALPGCAVHKAWKGEPGEDLASLKPGMTRDQIEAVVGTSDREWYTSLGVRYRLYLYDAGIPPAKSDASAILFLDVISLGMIEVIEAVSHESFTGKTHEFHDLAVSYDLHDVAIGIFTGVDTTTVLPEDGRKAGP
jgi:hypothetical protein